MHAYVVSCLLVGLLVGAADARPVPRPAPVIGKLSIGSPAGLDGVRAFADAIRPGTGGPLTTNILLASAFGASTGGLDLAGPVHVLFVDSGQASGAVLVARVADAAQLAPGAKAAGGWAVAGDQALTKLVATWALRDLVATAPPADVVGTLYPSAVLARYRTEIEQARATSGAAAAGLPREMVDAYWDMIMTLANETAEVVVRIDATKDLGAIDLSLVPRPRSRLAKFIALQRPSDFSLLRALPATKVMLVGGGRVAMGPYRKGLIDAMQVLFGPLSVADLGSSIDALMKAASGEVAFAMGLEATTGMMFDAVYALDDAKAADAAIARLINVIQTPITTTVGAITSSVQAVPGTIEHAGVTIRAYETTMTGGPPSPMRPPGGKLRMNVAIVDKLLVFASSSAQLAIDAARGAGPHLDLTRAQGELLDRARARKDSMAWVLDLAAMVAQARAPVKIAAGSNLLMSFGFADGAAHFSFAIPTSVIRSMVP